MKEKKKNISLLLALALLLGLLAGCGVKPAEAAGTGENTGESAETVQEAAGINTAESGAAAAAEPAKEGAMTSGMMMGNPWTDCESKEEAEKLAGFKIDTDLSLVEGADSMVYRVLGKDKASAEDRMLEVIWFDAAGE